MERPLFVPGDVFRERYRIKRLLGAGASGEVWLATDIHAAVDLAIKVVGPDWSPTFGDPEKLRRNFQMIRELAHPNIVTLRSLEPHLESGGYAFIMDYVDGCDLESLRRARSDRALPLGQALWVAREMAEALDFAFSRYRVVHRDVKPANVLIGRDGRLRITDFGIATLAPDVTAERSMAHHHPVGTPAYMAPEQWLGLPLDGRTDQYGLAATVRCLLAGTPSITAEAPGRIQAALLGDRPPLLKQLSRRQNAVLARALAKRQGDRFPTCREFVAELSAGLRASAIQPLTLQAAPLDARECSATLTDPNAIARGPIRARFDGSPSARSATRWTLLAVASASALGLAVAIRFVLPADLPSGVDDRGSTERSAGYPAPPPTGAPTDVMHAVPPNATDSPTVAVGGDSRTSERGSESTPRSRVEGTKRPGEPERRSATPSQKDQALHALDLLQKADALATSRNEDEIRRALKLYREILEDASLVSSDVASKALTGYRRAESRLLDLTTAGF